MKFKIDLKIFLIAILFFMTSQIKVYAIMMICAIIHELGHLLVGILLGMKPEKLEIIPVGIRVTFKINIKDINSKIKQTNKLEIKKIFVAIAGPVVNLILIYIAAISKTNIISKINFIYANLLLVIINLVPIYPLDGGRILKGILHIFLGKRKAERYTNSISFIILIILTFIASIGIYYMENISIFVITIFLWGLYLKQDKIDRNKNKIYDLIEKTIEISENK